MPLQHSTCKRVGARVGAQIRSLGRALGGLAGGFEAAGAAAQEEGERPDPWLRQGWPWGAATAEGGRRVNRLEGTVGEDHLRGNNRGGARIRVRVRVRVGGKGRVRGRGMARVGVGRSRAGKGKVVR